MGRPFGAPAGRVAPSTAARSFEATVSFLHDRAEAERDVEAFTVVHGVAGENGAPFFFAWLEIASGELCVDVASYPLALFPWEDFYGPADIGRTIRYSAREALDLAAQHGTCGPWDADLLTAAGPKARETGYGKRDRLSGF